MALHIEQERIDSGDLTDLEIDYLRQRNRLPAHYSDQFDERKLENQKSPTIADNGGIDEEDDEEDYEDGWNNDQRRAELSRRKLSVEGNKADLISRLRRSDSDQLEDDDYSKLED